MKLPDLKERLSRDSFFLSAHRTLNSKTDLAIKRPLSGDVVNKSFGKSHRSRKVEPPCDVLYLVSRSSCEEDAWTGPEILVGILNVDDLEQTTLEISKGSSGEMECKYVIGWNKESGGIEANETSSPGKI